MKPIQTAQAITLLAGGTSQKDIAKELGVTQPVISKIKKNNREAIQKETERLISCLPDIISQTIRDVQLSDKLSRSLSGEDVGELNPLFKSPSFIKSFMELSYRKQSDTLKALGVYTSASPSVFIETLIQSHTAVINPNILKALGSYMDENLKADIEVEVTP